LRLVVTRVSGVPKSVLYRPVVPGTPAASRVPFSSPWRTVWMDSVTDVSASTSLGTDAAGNVEVSIDLAQLGLTALAGTETLADVCVLRPDGSGQITIERVCWSNKKTALLADIPGEAELVPSTWGRITWPR
jgi:hypothetical protein